MKQILSIIAGIMLFASAYGQKAKLPDVTIKTLDGKSFSTAQITNQNKPVFIDFWATWCKPCIIELNTIADLYEDWQDETGVIIYAVSIDDPKTMARVAPFVNARDWDFNILLDPNSNFKRAMNVLNIPHSFIIKPDGTIFWSHTGFAPGDEEEIYDKLVELSEKLKNEKN